MNTRRHGLGTPFQITNVILPFNAHIGQAYSNSKFAIQGGSRKEALIGPSDGYLNEAGAVMQLQMANFRLNQSSIKYSM